MAGNGTAAGFAAEFGQPVGSICDFRYHAEPGSPGEGWSLLCQRGERADEPGAGECWLGFYRYAYTCLECLEQQTEPDSDSGRERGGEAGLLHRPLPYDYSAECLQRCQRSVYRL